MKASTFEKDNGIRTHSRYVGIVFLGLYNNKLDFKLASQPYKEFSDLDNKKIEKKISIISYTLKSIVEENSFANEDEEFMPLVISWVWIKGYYCFFHLMSIIIAYEKNDSKYILDKQYNSHTKISIIKF